MPPVLPALPRAHIYSRFSLDESPALLVSPSEHWRDMVAGCFTSTATQPSLMLDADPDALSVALFPTADSERERHVAIAVPPGERLFSDNNAAGGARIYSGAWVVDMPWMDRFGPGRLAIPPVMTEVPQRVLSSADLWREVNLDLGAIALSREDAAGSVLLDIMQSIHLLVPPGMEVWANAANSTLGIASLLPWFVSEEAYPTLRVFPGLTATPVQVLPSAFYWREVTLRVSAAATLGFSRSAAGGETFSPSPNWLTRLRVPPGAALYAASAASAQIQLLSYRSPRLRT